MPRTRHQKSIELSRDCRFPVFLFFSLGGRKCRNPTGFTQQSHKKALSLYLMRIKSQAVALVHRQSHRTPVSRHPQWQDLCTVLSGQPAQMGLVFFGIKGTGAVNQVTRSEEHTSELQSRPHLVCRLLLEKKKVHGAEGGEPGARG